MSNSRNTYGDSTTVRRREAAGWRASHSLEKGFVGFVGFVTKNNKTNQ
jgi:hypothetical protein